jgi:hypothetical protein
LGHRKHNEMTLVRIITAESLESIDLNNLGNHFTVEGNEPAIVSKIQHLSEDAQGGALFYVYVECDSINQEATDFSNEEHPSEKEVVTNANSTIKVLEILDDCFNVVAENLTGNTGSRVHEWVSKM